MHQTVDVPSSFRHDQMVGVLDSSQFPQVVDDHNTGPLPVSSSVNHHFTGQTPTVNLENAIVTLDCFPLSTSKMSWNSQFLWGTYVFITPNCTLKTTTSVKSVLILFAVDFPQHSYKFTHRPEPNRRDSGTNQSREEEWPLEFQYSLVTGSRG